MSRETKPWLPLYVDDFLGDETVKLASNRALGAYVKLLCHQWTHRSVPGNVADLAAIVGESRKDFERLWTRLREKFPEKKGRLVNPRLERERREADRVLRAKRKGARTANRVRAESVPDSVDSAVVQTQTQTQVVKPSSSSADAAELHDNITGPAHAVLDGLLRAAQNPAAAAAVIRSYGPGGTDGRYTWAEIGQALLEMAASNLPFTARLLAGCVRKVHEGEPGAKASGPTLVGGISRETALRRALEALGVVDDKRVPRGGFPSEEAFQRWLEAERQRGAA